MVHPLARLEEFEYAKRSLHFCTHVIHCPCPTKNKYATSNCRLPRDHLNHLLANHGRFTKPVLEELCRVLEPHAVALHVAQRNALLPSARRHHKLHVVLADLLVVQCRLDRIRQVVFVQEQIL